MSKYFTVIVGSYGSYLILNSNKQKISNIIFETIIVNTFMLTQSGKYVAIPLYLMLKIAIMM